MDALYVIQDIETKEFFSGCTVIAGKIIYEFSTWRLATYSVEEIRSEEFKELNNKLAQERKIQLMRVSLSPESA